MVYMGGVQNRTRPLIDIRIKMQRPTNCLLLGKEMARMNETLTARRVINENRPSLCAGHQSQRDEEEVAEKYNNAVLIELMKNVERP